MGRVTGDSLLADLLLDCIIANDGLVNAHTFARQYKEFDKAIEAGGQQIVRLHGMHIANTSRSAE